MPSLIQQLTDRHLISPPSWLPDNVMFEGVQGSNAYGVAVDTSDFDIVGYCIPPKDIVFPHLAGIIEGFGRQRLRFVCYQRHHVNDQQALGGKGRNYDLNIFNIVHYFQLCMDNNPNMVASLFLPVECILHTTQVGEMIRKERHIFLHKGAWHRFKGYAYSQLHKMSTKNSEPNSKRSVDIEKWGFDLKFAYNLVRLMYELEQILTTGTLDLRRNAEELKAIRRGDWTELQIRQWFSEKESSLERLYETSQLPWGPDEVAIKQLLLDCLETHYGTLEGCIVTDMTPILVLREIADVIDRHRTLIQ